MKVITDNKIPIKMWADDIEGSALVQANNLANLPFAYKHIALMPDVHMGYGMPIGGVMATVGVVVPNAVGVDIGCGMRAVKTRLTAPCVQIKDILSEIRRRVPLGFDKHEIPAAISALPILKDKHNVWREGGVPICEAEELNARKSLGTLGGGNHFIEIQKDENDKIWLMVHSGSRNLGKKVADYYNKSAKELNQRWHTIVSKEHDLAFIPIEDNLGKRYLNEMSYCLDFARSNRSYIMHHIMESVKTVLRLDAGEVLGDNDIFDVHHNYVQFEHHFGKNVLVHRKGATSAHKGEIGIIPGSQGTASYIVEGLGNPLSFNSCSHGAGRKMGRKMARENLNLADEISGLGDIIHSVRTEADLDEAPGAYKDIDVVMEQQKDLVKIKHKLTPLAVIKG